jgi:hypothetical protein
MRRGRPTEATCALVSAIPILPCPSAWCRSRASSASRRAVGSACWVFGPRLELGGRLLFPSFASGEEAPLRETRRLLDRVATRVGWKAGEIWHRLFRHTYCAARLQTLDHGAPVSPLQGESRAWSRFGGDGSAGLLALGHRAAPVRVVELLAEQTFERLGDQIVRLGYDITSVIRTGTVGANETPAPTEVEAGEDLPEWARRDSNARLLAPEPPEASDGQRPSA